MLLDDSTKFKMKEDTELNNKKKLHALKTAKII